MLMRLKNGGVKEIEIKILGKIKNFPSYLK
jgi:hypothetical protein